MYTSEEEEERNWQASSGQEEEVSPNNGALGIMSHIGVGAVVAVETACMGCGSSVTMGNDSSAALLGGEAVGRLAVDKVGELVD